METDDRGCAEGEAVRFGQLLRALPEASRKVAPAQLRELEREAIISRTAFGKRWERVEYSLTEYGKTLVPVLMLMADWGLKTSTSQVEIER
jgi:DNA-binding HxlR family transcriptional regulator